MSKRRPKAMAKGKARPRHTIWCREALSLARLIPPNETLGQDCFSCPGVHTKLYEIYDVYGRVCLCEKCLIKHISLLTEKAPIHTAPAKKRELPTYDEWVASADIQDLQRVVDRMKARLGKK